MHQIESKHECLLLPVSFTAKFELVFVLTLKNALSWRFYFKVNRKSICSSKNGTGDFQNSSLFERCFYVIISGNFERFKYFKFETDFLKK